jgi:dimeric dUTPase (all-alpha-NTP-PPase superfamily)
MNIKDVSEEIKIPDNIWIEIFNKQWELAQKYKEIESMGTLLETTEHNIDTAVGQRWIKDFCWRVTEELAEAQEASIIYADIGDEDALLHYKEELIDALHFLVEMTQIAGYDYTIAKYTMSIDSSMSTWSDVVYSMGLMCNTLKNKPWKQTQMLTDRNKFKGYLEDTWDHMINLLLSRMDEEEIYLFYFKKNKVNQFRQRSKY